MSLTVAENESGLCYNSKIRYLEKSEVTKRKTISCPDIEDYKTASQEPDVVWYKVTLAVLLLLYWNYTKLPLFSVWGLEMAFSEPVLVCDWSGGCCLSITEGIRKCRQNYPASASMRMFCARGHTMCLTAVPRSQTTVLPLYQFPPWWDVSLPDSVVETKGGNLQWNQRCNSTASFSSATQIIFMKSVG